MLTATTAQFRRVLQELEHKDCNAGFNGVENKQGQYKQSTVEKAMTSIFTCEGTAGEWTDNTLSYDKKFCTPWKFQRAWLTKELSFCSDGPTAKSTKLGAYQVVKMGTAFHVVAGTFRVSG